VLQFARYAALVASRGGKVILECQPELTRVLEGYPWVDRVVARGQPPGEFDCHYPLLDLPRLFQTELKTIPGEVSRLKANLDLVKQWKKRFRWKRKRLRVGLVWAGRATHSNDRHRSIPLSKFAPLAKVKSAAFYSLQKGEAANQMPPAGLEITDWTADLHDFADTAALIENLDMVLTVDTAVAHLAGAMGKPTWLLLPYIPDWRWLLDREDSPWYPSMRLFRQPAYGEWDSVIRDVAEQLKAQGKSL
jgi:hypothetical protein